MTNNWKDCSLGDVIELKRGYDLPQKERLYGEVPLVSSSGITDTHAKAMVEGPGVVTGRYGTLGQVFYVRQNFWPLNTTLYVRDFKGNDPRFISYFLREVDFLVYSDKAAVPGLNRNHLHQAKVRIPTDLTEQRRIAHILGTLDDKIENNRKTAKTLEAMAKNIFQSWFVDFDPVRAKMAGESPESICKRLKLTPEILDLFPDRLVDSELGEIPEGWEIKPLDSLAALTTDSISPGRSPHSVFEHYSIPAFDLGRMPTMELGESIKSNKYLVKHNAVLVSKLNPHTPRIWLPAVGKGAAICSTEFMQFVPHECEDSPYLYCLMVSQTMQEEVLKHVNGSTGSRQRAQPSQIAKVKMLFPQFFIKKAFNHQASSLLQAIAKKLTASSTLATLRDVLLPKLISGKMRVSDNK